MLLPGSQKRVVAAPVAEFLDPFRRYRLEAGAECVTFEYGEISDPVPELTRDFVSSHSVDPKISFNSQGHYLFIGDKFFYHSHLVRDLLATDGPQEGEEDDEDDEYWFRRLRSARMDGDGDEIPVISLTEDRTYECKNVIAIQCSGRYLCLLLRRKTFPALTDESAYDYLEEEESEEEEEEGERREQRRKRKKPIIIWGEKSHGGGSPFTQIVRLYFEGKLVSLRETEEEEEEEEKEGESVFAEESCSGICIRAGNCWDYVQNGIRITDTDSSSGDWCLFWSWREKYVYVRDDKENPYLREHRLDKDKLPEYEDPASYYGGGGESVLREFDVVAKVLFRGLEVCPFQKGLAGDTVFGDARFGEEFEFSSGAGKSIPKRMSKRSVIEEVVRSDDARYAIAKITTCAKKEKRSRYFSQEGEKKRESVDDDLLLGMLDKRFAELYVLIDTSDVSNSSILLDKSQAEIIEFILNVRKQSSLPATPRLRIGYRLSESKMLIEADKWPLLQRIFSPLADSIPLLYRDDMEGSRILSLLELTDLAHEFTLAIDLVEEDSSEERPFDEYLSSLIGLYLVNVERSGEVENEDVRIRSELLHLLLQKILEHVHNQITKNSFLCEGVEQALPRLLELAFSSGETKLAELALELIRIRRDLFAVGRVDLVVFFSRVLREEAEKEVFDMRKVVVYKSALFIALRGIKAEDLVDEVQGICSQLLCTATRLTRLSRLLRCQVLPNRMSLVCPWLSPIALRFRRDMMKEFRLNRFCAVLVSECVRLLDNLPDGVTVTFPPGLAVDVCFLLRDFLQRRRLLQNSQAETLCRVLVETFKIQDDETEVVTPTEGEPVDYSVADWRLVAFYAVVQGGVSAGCFRELLETLILRFRFSPLSVGLMSRILCQHSREWVEDVSLRKLVAGFLQKIKNEFPNVMSVSSDGRSREMTPWFTGPHGPFPFVSYVSSTWFENVILDLLNGNMPLGAVRQQMVVLEELFVDIRDRVDVNLKVTKYCDPYAHLNAALNWSQAILAGFESDSDISSVVSLSAELNCPYEDGNAVGDVEQLLLVVRFGCRLLVFLFREGEDANVKQISELGLLSKLGCSLEWALKANWGRVTKDSGLYHNALGIISELFGSIVHFLLVAELELVKIDIEAISIYATILARISSHGSPQSAIVLLFSDVVRPRIETPAGRALVDKIFEVLSVEVRVEGRIRSGAIRELAFLYVKYLQLVQTESQDEGVRTVYAVSGDFVKELIIQFLAVTQEFLNAVSEIFHILSSSIEGFLSDLCSDPRAARGMMWLWESTLRRMAHWSDYALESTVVEWLVEAYKFFPSREDCEPSLFLEVCFGDHYQSDEERELVDEFRSRSLAAIRARFGEDKKIQDHLAQKFHKYLVPVCLYANTKKDPDLSAFCLACCRLVDVKEVIAHHAESFDDLKKRSEEPGGGFLSDVVEILLRDDD